MLGVRTSPEVLLALSLCNRSRGDGDGGPAVDWKRSEAVHLKGNVNGVKYPCQRMQMSGVVEHSRQLRSAIATTARRGLDWARKIAFEDTAEQRSTISRELVATRPAYAPWISESNPSDRQTEPSRKRRRGTRVYLKSAGRA